VFNRGLAIFLANLAQCLEQQVWCIDAHYRAIVLDANEQHSSLVMPERVREHDNHSRQIGCARTLRYSIGVSVFPITKPDQQFVVFCHHLFPLQRLDCGNLSRI
jgi:hypothetical protein